MFLLAMLGSSWLATVLSVAPLICPRASYRPPVSSPVTLGFSLPLGPYGPGNRGLEYATASGERVRAVGSGRVLFAGPVAGQLAISVLHGDGVLASYSYLHSIRVARGEAVSAGQLLGTSSNRLQLGFRRNGVYFDPAPYLGAALRPRLVGSHVGPPALICPI